MLSSIGAHGGGISLDADGRLLSTADADETDAGELGDLGGQAGIGIILNLGESQGIRKEGQGQDGGVRRIGFAIDGRSGQVCREIGSGGVDGLLNFLLSYVDAEGRLNSRVMTELPSELMEVICLSPGT